MSFFSSLFGGDSGYDAAARAKQLGLATGYGQATDLYQQGRDVVSNYTGRAAAPLQSVFDTGTAGLNLYGDVTGAGGAAGQDRARALFQTDPGYQFARDEALQATERARGTGGYQGSGNLLTPLQDRASGLAAGQYGNWVSRLLPLVGTATTGAAGLANVYSGAGNTLGSSLSNQGNLAYNTQAGIGNAQAAADIAQQNQQNSLFSGLLGLGTKLLGYGGGSGGVNAPGSTSLFGGAGSIFGGTNPNAWYTG